MKQIAAILFFLILIFNFCGYQWVIIGIKNNSVATIEKQVDRNNYSDDELTSIKTTLNLPYYSSSSDYERAYGSITIEGKDYEYVKRRVYKDTLELLCLPNHTKTELQSVGNEFAKSSADGQSDNKNNSIKISLPAFFQQHAEKSGSVNIIKQQWYISFNTSLIFDGFSTRQERPPQV